MKRNAYCAFWVLILAATAHATVTSQSTSVSFTCSGSIGPYPFTFPLSDAPTVQVPLSLTVTENGTVLTTGAYTATPVNNNYVNGGSVTLTTACPAGETLVLTRNTPQTQTSSFTPNMPIPVKTIENGLDKLTEIAQEISDATAARAGPGACPGNEYEISDTPEGPVCALAPSGGNLPPGCTSNGDYGIVCTGGFLSGTIPTNLFSLYPLSTMPASWTLDVTTPVTAYGFAMATDYFGSDIGAQINAAFAACSNACAVVVPPGSYSFSTTINYPVVSNGNAALIISPGATLNYTGSTNAIYAGALVATTNSRVLIGGGGTLKCASCTGNGIYSLAWNNGLFRDLSITGFTSGAGVYNAGPNNLTIYNVSFTSNATGIYNTGGTPSFGGSYSANAIVVEASNFSGNGWAIQDGVSGSLASTGNRYVNNTIENQTTGGIQLDGDNSTLIQGNYFENQPHNIVVGVTHNTFGVTIDTNSFTVSSATPNTIELGTSGGGGAENITIRGNTEYSTGSTCFVDGILYSGSIVVGPNQVTSASNICGDNGSILRIGDSSGLSGFQGSFTGLQFNVVNTNSTQTTLTGTSGSATCSQGFQGRQKITTCFLSGYANTSTAQTYAYPTAYSAFSLLIGTTTGGTSCGTYNPTSTTSTLSLPANASMTAETCSITVIGQ